MSRSGVLSKHLNKKNYANNLAHTAAFFIAKIKRGITFDIFIAEHKNKAKQ